MDQNQENQINMAPAGGSDKGIRDSGGGGMPDEHKKVGPIAVILVVVLIVIITALYFFASHLNEQAVPVDNETVAGNQAAPQSVPTVTNTADDPQAIQSDLNQSTAGLDDQNF